MPRSDCQKPAVLICYEKHFLLLSAASGALILAYAAHLLDQLAPTFGLYGVLHAAAVVFSLRAPASVARKFLFIAVSACLSVLTLYLSLAARPMLGWVGGIAGPYLLIGFSSLFGALTYVALIRLMWVRSLTIGSMTAIAGTCALTTLAAVFALMHFSVFGRWFLALAWWYALSGGLWLFEITAVSRTRGVLR